MFSLPAAIPSLIPFIGNYAFLNLISFSGVILALIIHSNGNFAIAKRVAIYSIFIAGGFITALSGGDFLYHIGVITGLVFSWVVFNNKNERPELLLFILFTIYVYVIGEYNLFNAPDFSQDPDIQIIRTSNLIGYTVILLIFVNFMRSLNKNYEKQLKQTIKEKEALVQTVLDNSKELKHERTVLEKVVLERTEELQEQKNFLEEQNKEKEILLKEIHHRVKNNLQIIVSLLNLQASNFKDKQVLKAIEETQNRIISMSLVHQRMYQTSNFINIEIHDYINLLMDNNKALYALKDNNEFVFNNNTYSDLRVDVEKAIPLGLIINEMITNSIKYATSDSTGSTTIDISIEELENEYYSITYRDNGPGLSDEFTLDSSNTLGIQLISALIEQLDGELSYHNDNGAVFQFTFKN